MEEQNNEVQAAKRAKALEKISERLDGVWTADEVDVISRQVAKGANMVELMYFLNVCKSTGLNPFVREIWSYKDKQDNLLVFAGRDGFLSKAQQSPQFRGIRSCEVRKNDHFEANIPAGHIDHRFGFADRGEIVGAYAIVFREPGEPTIEVAEFKRYNKGRSAWKTHPEEMIKKVAEAHALKKAFGINGIQVAYDWNVNEDTGIATPLEQKKKTRADHEEDRARALINNLDEPDQLRNAFAPQFLEEHPAIAQLLAEKLEFLEDEAPEAEEVDPNQGELFTDV